MATETIDNTTATGMKPTLGLTGLTINAMALIAPGAFLWTTYQLQAAPGSAMSHVVRGICSDCDSAVYRDGLLRPC